MEESITSQQSTDSENYATKEFVDVSGSESELKSEIAPSSVGMGSALAHGSWNFETKQAEPGKHISEVADEALPEKLVQAQRLETTVRSVIKPQSWKEYPAHEDSAEITQSAVHDPEAVGVANGFAAERIGESRFSTVNEIARHQSESVNIVTSPSFNFFLFEEPVEQESEKDPENWTDSSLREFSDRKEKMGELKSWEEHGIIPGAVPENSQGDSSLHSNFDHVGASHHVSLSPEDVTPVSVALHRNRLSTEIGHDSKHSEFNDNDDFNDEDDSSSENHEELLIENKTTTVVDEVRIDRSTLSDILDRSELSLQNKFDANPMLTATMLVPDNGDGSDQMHWSGYFKEIVGKSVPNFKMKTEMQSKHAIAMKPKNLATQESRSEEGDHINNHSIDNDETSQ